MKVRSVLAALLALSGCTTLEKAVTTGQLYCALATKDGPLVVAIVDAAGAPVFATGAASAFVAATCAAIDAIPVSPPASPATAPVVSVNTQAVAAKLGKR